MEAFSDNTQFVTHAAAKVNVALHVIGQRADGYHLIDSLVMFPEAGDKIRITIDHDSDIISLEITGPFSQGLPSSEDNLIVKAARALLEKAQLKVGLSITLTKNLPVASGIGGGSADAAATLLLLKTALDLPQQFNLQGIAEMLGADVPMCLHSKNLIAHGIGEEIELVDNLPRLEMLLVNPGTSVSTPEVFRKLTRKDNSPMEPIPSNPSGEELIEWLKAQRNDLEGPAIGVAPIIKIVLEAIQSSGAQVARMSGSGATCFGIFSDTRTCESARLQIVQNHPDWWCVATHTRKYGIPDNVQN